MMSSMVAGGGSNCESDAVIVAPMMSRVCEMMLPGCQCKFALKFTIKLTIERLERGTEDDQRGER